MTTGVTDNQPAHAVLPGGWSIDYVYGIATFEGRTVEGLHVLRIYGDITRPDELRKAIDTFRRSRLMTEGPTVLHSPLGPIKEWECP